MIHIKDIKKAEFNKSYKFYCIPVLFVCKKKIGNVHEDLDVETIIFLAAKQSIYVP